MQSAEKQRRQDTQQGDETYDIVESDRSKNIVVQDREVKLGAIYR
jgi:hypothetical protein